MLSLVAASCLSAVDLARPLTKIPTERLSASPNIWLTHDFLSPSAVAHLISKVPKDEAAYSPCIGQVTEFASKRCTHLPVDGDEVVTAAIEKIGTTWDIDVTELSKGLPVIRYLPGAPPVGLHGDEDRHGLIPNATLVLYLTSPSGSAGGQTIFPDAGVTVTPRLGSIVSFQNVDEAGEKHPLAKHSVGAVPADATSDRLVLQVPIRHKGHGTRPYAYPEHVSGAKKPGQHESMHGTADQKAAFQAAVAAGVGLGLAYMAAKAGKFDEGAIEDLKAAAAATGKFTEDELKTK